MFVNFKFRFANKSSGDEVEVVVEGVLVGVEEVEVVVIVDADFAFKTLNLSGFIQFCKLGLKIKITMKMSRKIFFMLCLAVFSLTNLVVSE